MMYRRDVYTQRGCLEYSWVPEGKRRVILLNPGQREGDRTDPGPDAASHVQVYRLVSGEFGAANLQFPEGPPHKAPLTHAIVEVFQQRMEVVGTVYYADGTNATSTFPLTTSPMPCPELPSGDAA